MMPEIGYALLISAYVVLGLYVIMVLYALRGWKKLKTLEEMPPHHAVSILVAARNESAHIQTVIRDLFKQSYPANLFEVIVIDDHSEDDTLAKAEELKTEHPSLHVFSNDEHDGKKGALATGIKNAKFAIVATVDADCRVPSEWLITMVSHWEEDRTKMLLGPVVLEPAVSVLERVQLLEMHAIMGLTGGFAAHGHPIMANGANLFFEKKGFEQIGGYGNSRNPSGDDVFTMLQFDAQWPGSVTFVKEYESAVLTAPQPTFSAFWQQRKRWLSKKGGYRTSWVKSTAIITYLANVAGFCSLMALIFSFGTFWTDKLLWIIFIKTLVDLILVRAVSRDLQPYCGIAHIMVAEIFIVCYVTFLGIFGNVKNYVWKGREIKVTDESRNG